MTTPAPSAVIQDAPIPPGSYTITPGAHRRFVEHSFGDDVFASVEGGDAHPAFAHLATHCGKSWTFNRFLEHVGAVPEDGVVFGGGTWDIRLPLVIGQPYEIDAWISGAVRKSGRRLGVFDAITMTHEAKAGGTVAVRTTETYIVPRSGATTSADDVLAGQAPPPPPALVPPAGGEVRHTVGPVGIERIQAIMEVMDDTNPVHVDLDLALRTGYRGRVNQGPANLAYVLAAVARWRGGLADLRHVGFQFRDTVTEVDVLDVVAPASITEDDSAIVRLDVHGGGTAVVAELSFATD